MEIQNEQKNQVKTHAHTSTQNTISMSDISDISDSDVSPNDAVGEGFLPALRAIDNDDAGEGFLPALRAILNPVPVVLDAEVTIVFSVIKQALRRGIMGADGFIINAVRSYFNGIINGECRGLSCKRVRTHRKDFVFDNIKIQLQFVSSSVDPPERVNQNIIQEDLKENKHKPYK